MAATEPKTMTVETDTPSMKAIRAETGRRLVVTWKNGAESLVDVAEHIARYAVFLPLLIDDTAFRDVVLGEWGWSAHWTDEMEMSADTLWRLALEQGSAWLRQWRGDHSMTQTEAATALGVSSRMWRYYEAGTHLMPKTVRLACIGLDAQAKAA